MDCPDEPVTVGAVFGGLTAGETIVQNKRIKSAAEASQRNVNAAAKQEKMVKSREYDAYVSALRANAGERGVGMVGSVAGAMTVAGQRFIEDANTIDVNRTNQNIAIARQANSQMSSPLVEGLVAGLQGMLLGKQLAGPPPWINGAVTTNSASGLPGVSLNLWSPN